MKLPMPVLHLGSCPIDDIVTHMPEAGDPVWDRFARRQRQYSVHTLTRSIAFIWSDGWVKDQPLALPLNYAPRPLTQAAMACGERILSHYPGGRIMRLMLTELVAGGEIPRHRDQYRILEDTHRCHLPVITQPGVAFMIDDEEYYFEPGEMYEFDNMRPHAVRNGTSSRRIHLICNIIPA